MAMLGDSSGGFRDLRGRTSGDRNPSVVVVILLSPPLGEKRERAPWSSGDERPLGNAAGPDGVGGNPRSKPLPPPRSLTSNFLYPAHMHISFNIFRKASALR